MLSACALLQVAVCDVWTEHTGYGAWRCKNRACKSADTCVLEVATRERDAAPAEPPSPGMRNSIDAEFCVYCEQVIAPATDH